MCVVLDSRGSKQRVGADETGERPPEAGETRRGKHGRGAIRGGLAGDVVGSVGWLSRGDRCSDRSTSGWGEAGEGREYELGCVVLAGRG